MIERVYTMYIHPPLELIAKFFRNYDFYIMNVDILLRLRTPLAGFCRVFDSKLQSLISTFKIL